jgi:amino-acid N-acetyltransferase
VRAGIRLFRASVVWAGSDPRTGGARVGVQSRGLARAFGFEFPSPAIAEPARLQLERSRPEDLQEALALLHAVDLPSEGVAEGFRDYLVVRDGRRLVAVCGLETHGPHGLLRSLAVEAECRGAGLGASLVEEAVTRAAARGMRDVYLLTTTARPFFLRHGFVDVPREQAPDPIRDSWEYTTGCPDDAAFMRRPLASTR